MLQWGHPAALLGLALIPLVWWLHKFRLTQTPRRVAALFLWQDDADGTGKRAQKSTIDKQWRRRALLVSLLTLAGAAPLWTQGKQPPIDLWLDDSLSMRTIEDGSSRLESAFNTFTAALQPLHPAAVRIHSLGHPGLSLELSTAATAQWHNEFIDWLPPPADKVLLPLPTAMATSADHWLITDGAEPTLHDWLASAPISRIIQSGNLSENAVISRLSLRPSIDNESELQGLVTIENTGSTITTRRLELREASTVIVSKEVSINGSESVQISFTVPGTLTATLEAALLPADALAIDDRLTLDRDKVATVNALISGPCPEPLTFALKSLRYLHPVSNEGDAGLFINCGIEQKSSGHPQLHLHPSAHTALLPAPAHWTAAAGTLRNISLSAISLRYDPATTGDPKDIPLLATDTRPLITLSKDSPRRIDVYLDLANPEFARQPEYPLLISGLLELAVGRDLLEGISQATRVPAESVIAPEPLTTQYKQAPVSTRDAIDLSPYLILLALLLLMMDLSPLSYRTQRQA